MKRFLFFSLVFLGALMCSCDQSAIQVTQCAISDSKLSIAFKDPHRAKSYLIDLGQRLKNKDESAVREAGDLVARIVECLPNP